MEIRRERYLDRLIAHKHNGRIKVVTGLRRSGKTFLLFELFRSHLIEQGVPPERIIQIAFDDRANKELRDPDVCYGFIRAKIEACGSSMCYVLLDEVQMLGEFADVLNGLLHVKNADVYATGSNSKFLSTDVMTQFRGRGDEIRVYPLSFSEFYGFRGGDWEDAWNQYYTYGGLPYVACMDADDEKAFYLQNLFKETYIQDIVERNSLRGDQALGTLIDIAASSIGSLVNPQKLSHTFASMGKVSVSAPTIKKYLRCLEEAFVIHEALRYDIKGKSYISTPSKYYFEDVGLRNARLNFRQQEENHIMENVIYNELRVRGFAVDVGVVELRERGADGLVSRRQTEIDFVANKGSRRYYVQSAFRLPTDEKRAQEERPLLGVRDAFKKIVVVRDNIMLKRDDRGVTTMGLKEFLLDPDSLDL